MFTTKYQTWRSYEVNYALIICKPEAKISIAAQISQDSSDKKTFEMTSSCLFLAMPSNEMYANFDPPLNPPSTGSTRHESTIPGHLSAPLRRSLHRTFFCSDGPDGRRSGVGRGVFRSMAPRWAVLRSTRVPLIPAIPARNCSRQPAFRRYTTDELEAALRQYPGPRCLYCIVMKGISVKHKWCVCLLGCWSFFEAKSTVVGLHVDTRIFSCTAAALYQLQL